MPIIWERFNYIHFINPSLRLTEIKGMPMIRWLSHKHHSRRAVSKPFHVVDTATLPEQPLVADLETNLASIRTALHNSNDLKIRKFFFWMDREREAALVFIDGLVDVRVLEDHILAPLMVETYKTKNETKNSLNKGLTWIEEHLLTANSLARLTAMEETVNAILTGDTVLLVAGFNQAIQISSKGWEKRGIQEPDTEVNIKGSREGFIENIRTNTALLRRKVGHHDLTFESLTVGRKTKTDLTLTYIRGIVREELVTEVKKRIGRIETDAILDAGILEQYIEDAPLSLFPTVNYTERPEVVAARILEGRVAIMVDGTPVVNTVPMLFMESFQTPDDYNFRWLFSTLIRWIRFLASLLTIIMPAMYVALSTFHQEMIPVPLLISMAAAEDATPFPAVFEVLIMGIIFEILREAGIRLPRPIGAAVSIVGALVVGDAAVNAGLVGAPVVIVVALTAITSFVIPFQVESITVIRLGLIVFAAVFGLFGILNGLLLVLIHLAALRSFGVPYLSPLAPWVAADLSDTITRTPLWTMLKRPRSLETTDPSRQTPGLEPRPPKQ
jgi:spore germination protein KA